jgi:hypothetical protein
LHVSSKPLRCTTHCFLSRRAYGLLVSNGARIDTHVLILVLFIADGTLHMHILTAAAAEEAAEAHDCCRNTQALALRLLTQLLHHSFFGNFLDTHVLILVLFIADGTLHILTAAAAEEAAEVHGCCRNTQSSALRLLTQDVHHLFFGNVLALHVLVFASFFM